MYKNALNTLYPSCKTETKLALLNYLKDRAGRLNTTYADFLKRIYCDGYKDMVYFGIMANTLNKHFVISRRSRHV